ncbi:MAG: type II toxin-antitoxin system VapC family toxin [Dehalococcoidia bacterium]|nr:type II toxin-antitoxin system VapC family toxin [Dehalococcoidia bacterium]
MIVPDLNLLIYAYNDGVPFHPPARRWWGDLLNGSEPIGVPLVVAVGFIRISTLPSVLSIPFSADRALDTVEEWFRLPHVSLLNPGPEHLALMQRALAAIGAGGNIVNDAHVAALAMEYQAEVHSNDADFSRFPGLRWRNPL